VTELLLKVAASYLLGSLIGSLIVGRLRGGVDIRALGSGNAGGTNALRTQGKAFAFWVIVIDVGKAFVAARVIANLALPVADASAELQPWIAPACGFAAILGHVFPVWYGLRGGKGVASLVGAILGLSPLLFVPVIAAWLAVLVTSGYVGLASMTATAVLPLVIDFGGFEPRAPLITFGVLAAALTIFTHRSNIARMRAGTEPRARKVWLLGRGRS
jgi:acyl phosphate:glycerol-3-phosphate acyltransferase